ncbi:MAG: gamma-glutamyltransferase [Acetobacteraceae bacterium]|nr:gamma-glutamyltransferase [Acetobacteraceae bacterium]
MRKQLLLASILAASLGPALPSRAQMVSQTASSREAMVVTDQHIASEVGRVVLDLGGNAIDAAVAIGYALAVVDPCCGNLGGGGFMTIHLQDGRDTFINFRERAPLAATPTLYQDQNGNVIPGLSLYGYLAVGVPGTVAGLEKAREKYGTKPRAELIAPAIALAAAGFVLDEGDITELSSSTSEFAQQPNVAAVFLKGGQPYQVGDRLVQTDLARTLLRIAVDGPDAFYKGPIADAVVAASAANGGILSKADFEQYTAEELTPVQCNYRGYRVVSSPPPSSGGTVICEILNVLKGYDLSQLGFHSTDAVHYTVEAERQAYADRNTYLGDPDFISNPLSQLLSASYAQAIRAQIEPATAGSSAATVPGLGGIATEVAEGPHTTHYSVVDRMGNAVSVTYTINNLFGAGVIAGDTGFLLNDEMDDFTSKPGVPNLYGLVQGSANDIQPGKRPLSSMSPSILLRGSNLYMVVGAPGGSRIPTEVLGVIQNVIDYGMDIGSAVAAPRIHHQYLPDTVYLEPNALSSDVAAALQAEGYNLTQQTTTWGLAEAILIDQSSGLLTGATDPRRPDGLAVGTP